MGFLAPLDYLVHRFVSGKLPQISPSEMEALQAGTDGDGWYAELMSGKPDWDKLFELAKPQLSVEENYFLGGDVEDLIGMIDNHQVLEKKELPPEVIEFMKERGFLGMIIPKEYGGKGFSTLAHSAVVIKLAAHSTAAAVVATIPNSLGPAELLNHYGTDEQKTEYLPKLARGEYVPCFGLTELTAGSDAASIRSKGVVYKDETTGETRIKLDIDKRYITLAPISNLVGMAFKIEDPEGLLPPGTLDPKGDGITVGLLKTHDEKGSPVPGISVGNRHDPCSPFINGTVEAHDVSIGLNEVIGGPEKIGKGWGMLMETLGIGRAVALPSISEGHTKLNSLLVSSRPRRQFGMDISKFPAVQGNIADVTVLAYLMNASRLATIAMIDQRHEKPAIPSAVVKYHSTEDARAATNMTMDVLAGQGIMRGPGNMMQDQYMAAPIGITVEGANLMTGSVILGGQAVIRTHPHFIGEVEAHNDNNKPELRRRVLRHAFSTVTNMFRSFGFGLSNGHGTDVPDVDPDFAKYYRQINRLSASFNVAADATYALMGGKLKREELIANRIGMIGSNLYRASTALWAYKTMGHPEAMKPVVMAAVEEALMHAEQAMDELYKNHPNKHIAKFLRGITMPRGRQNHGPHDDLRKSVANMAVDSGDVRRFMQDGLSHPANDEPLGRILHGHRLGGQTYALYKLLRDNKYHVVQDNVLNESELGRAQAEDIITGEQADLIREYEALLVEINKVDIYSRDLSEHVDGPGMDLG